MRGILPQNYRFRDMEMNGGLKLEFRRNRTIKLVEKPPEDIQNMYSFLSDEERLNRAKGTLKFIQNFEIDKKVKSASLNVTRLKTGSSKTKGISVENFQSELLRSRLLKIIQGQEEISHVPGGFKNYIVRFEANEDKKEQMSKERKLKHEEKEKKRKLLNETFFKKFDIEKLNFKRWRSLNKEKQDLNPEDSKDNQVTHTKKTAPPNEKTRYFSFQPEPKNQEKTTINPFFTIRSSSANSNIMKKTHYPTSNRSYYNSHKKSTTMDRTYISATKSTSFELNLKLNFSMNRNTLPHNTRPRNMIRLNLKDFNSTGQNNNFRIQNQMAPKMLRGSKTPNKKNLDLEDTTNDTF